MASNVFLAVTQNNTSWYLILNDWIVFLRQSKFRRMVELWPKQTTQAVEASCVQITKTFATNFGHDQTTPNTVHVCGWTTVPIKCMLLIYRGGCEYDDHIKLICPIVLFRVLTCWNVRFGEWIRYNVARWAIPPALSAFVFFQTRAEHHVTTDTLKYTINVLVLHKF